MTKEIFLYIASLLVLTPLLSVTGEISAAHQLMFSAPFILVLGIPHGAIDNVLYTREIKLSNTHFIAIYVLIIGLNILLWLFSPLAAYLLFLALSAYHFGQSQFSHYFTSQKFLYQLIYFCWGTSVLTSLILFNLDEVQALMATYQEFAVFESAHNRSALLAVFAITLFLNFAFMVWLVRSRKLKLDSFFLELLILLLIMVSFYLMPLIVGFTLYFVILHSFKVLREEYRFLFSVKLVSSYKGFVRLLTPFSALSLLGIAMLFALIHFEILNIAYGYSMLIIISSITLPHVFVMNKFYRLLVKK